MKEATKASVGSVDELAGGCELAQLSVDDHADLVGERRGVLEVVRDEDGRQRKLVQELLELGAHGALRVGVERRERFVEQDHARAAGERAREGDPLPLAARERRRLGVGEMGDAEALEIFVGALLARVGDVLADRQVREERVFLEDEADAPLVRLAEEPPRAVQPDVVAERDLPARRTHEPRDRPQHRASCRRPTARPGRRCGRRRALAPAQTSEEGA